MSSKKIRDTNGIFHAKMGTIKDRIKVWTYQKQNILRKGGKNTQKNSKNILMTQITMMLWLFI